MNLRPGKVMLAAAGLVFVAAAGCTDPTVAPKSTVTSTNIMTDQRSAENFLAKVYAGLAVGGQQGGDGNVDIGGIDGGFSQYMRLYWEHQELPTDEAVIGWGDIGLPEMNTATWTSQSNMVVAMYYRVFFQVGMANEFLRQSTDAALAARGVTNGSALYGAIQGYRAEARFLRALSYWHGIDLFGSIPLVTENVALGVATPPQQATRQAVYDFVVSELNAIKTQLPTPGAGTYGRATTAAANMLLAKVYMNAQVYTGTAHWADAMAAIQAVIAGPFSLAPKYRNNFLADNNTSPEIVFPVVFDGLHTQTWGGLTFLIHAACGGSMDNNAYGINGCWWGIRLKQQAYNNYDIAGGDTARTSFFYTTGQSVNVGSIGDWAQGIAAPKFSNKTSTGGNGSDAGFPDTDFPMFRLADAYLMYAEAFLRGGGGTQSQALTYVNAIRERAYGGVAGDITGTQLTLPFILAERGRELLWEGHRRTDLIRFGLFTGSTYLWAWKGGTAAGAALASKYDLYPLPANELIANPNLTQNPGY
jgi:hypothetical protein